MKNLLVLFFFMFVQNTSAQLRPSQSQYLKEMGVLVNPGFEQGLEGWTLTGGCTSSFVSDVPFLNRSLRLSCTNAQFSVSQTSTDLSNFAGQQALASVQVKVSAGSVKVANLANATREHELTINSGDYKKAEIPFVANATSNGIEIFTDTNITADITIDLAEVSLAPNLIQQVSQAQYIGGIEVFDEGGGCAQSSTAATFQDWPADTDCGYQNAEGNLSAPSTDGHIGFTLSNVRTDGVYLVTAIGGLWDATAGASTMICHNAIGETSDIGSSDLASFYALRGVTGSNLEAYDGGALKARYFKFDSNTDKQIRMLIKRQTGSSNCNYTVGGNWPTVRFEVTFYPDSTSNVVAQTQELTAPVVTAEGNAGQSITSNVTDIPFIETRDDDNAWDGDSFTVPEGKGGVYRFSGQVNANAAGTFVIVAYLNGTIHKRAGISNVNANEKLFVVDLDLEENDVVSFRSTSNITLSNNAIRHHLTITRAPDFIKSQVVAGSFTEELFNTGEKQTNDTFDGKPVFRTCYDGVTPDETIVTNSMDDLVRVYGYFDLNTNYAIPVNYASGGTFGQFTESSGVAGRLKWDASGSFNVKACVEYTKL